MRPAFGLYVDTRDTHRASSLNCMYLLSLSGKAGNFRTFLRRTYEIFSVPSSRKLLLIVWYISSWSEEDVRKPDHPGANPAICQLCDLGKSPFLKIFMYVCIWLLWVLVAACGILNLSCGMWDLVLWRGIEPKPPALGQWSLSHWTTRKVPLFCPLPSLFFPSLVNLRWNWQKMLWCDCHFKAYNSMTFLIFTILCNHHLCLFQKHFITPRREPCTPYTCFSPQDPNLLPVSMDLLILDISYKWNYIICDLLCLASFT